MEVFGIDITVESVVFFVASIIVLGGAFGVIWSRNTVHAALSLVATLFGVAVIFTNMEAYFLAAVQVIVYTGAIVVLILFVIMLLGVDNDEDFDDEPLVGQFGLGLLVAIGVAGIIAGAVFVVGGDDILTGAPAAASGAEHLPDIQQIGRILFTDYVFAVEVTALVLTVAVVGAVVMARRATNLTPVPEPASMDAPEGLDPELEGEVH